MKRVGILGASGKIGFMVCEILQHQYEIKGGCRNYRSIFDELENFKWEEVDLYSSESLKMFCTGCDVILNCAGPAGTIKEKIAVVAGNLGIPYVDTADIILTDNEARTALPEGGIYVGGAGYVPGLGGLILKYIAACEYEQLDRVKCYQGGKQHFSEIAFTDIILGALSGSGKGDVYYRNGRILTERNTNGFKAKFPGCTEEVFTKSFLSEEMLDAAKRFGVRELHWMNMVSDEKMMSLIMDSFQIVMTKERQNALDEIKERVREYIAQDDQTIKEWSALVMECRGKEAQMRKEIKVSFEVKKEEQACGMVAALTVKHLLENSVNEGMYWAHEIVSTDEIREMIKHPHNGVFTIETL